MLHRNLHAFNLSTKCLGEPTDLPNVIREDLLMLAAVHPSRLFVTWHVSYSTQNRLCDYIGETTFNECRLMLVLKHMGASADEITIDVSGPSTSRYVDLTKFPYQCDEQGHHLDAQHLYGELSYRYNDATYPVTRSNLITLPRLFLSDRIDIDRQPLTPLFERLYRRLDPQGKIMREQLTLTKMGELLDAEIGVSTTI